MTDSIAYKSNCELDYESFLESKKIIVQPSGFDVSEDEINPKLFQFQRDIVRWALRKGRAAVFAGTGLGKTGMQLEWAKHIHKYTGGDVLILAPLAVSQQTVREGEKFGIEVHLCRKQADVKPGINITNYEILQHFDTNHFVGVVLDESSILKAYDGKTRDQIIKSFSNTPFKLSCTATPAPNDHMELGNQAEFLGVMTRAEMLAMFFVHDGSNTSQWRLKGHAKEKFWEWVASWAVMLQKPSDLGYDDNGFILPPLNIHQATVKSKIPEGMFFVAEARGLQETRKAMRDSLEDRVAKCAEIVNNSNSEESWIIWCNLNSESEALTKAINGAMEVRGNHSPEYKEQVLTDFATGKIKRLVTKSSIAGFGLNMQVCNKQAFVGLFYSFEQWFQAIRRSWRFGQKNPVDVYVVTSEAEGAVVETIKRKERDFEVMLSGMIAATQEITKENIRRTGREVLEYQTDIVMGKDWKLYLGDCVEVIREIESDSIHYSIFSPPFASLYCYSNSERDMGNCRGVDDFTQHFRFLVKELYRVMMPGRLLSFHCMNLPTSKQYHGYIGIQDFRGDLIRLFQEEGFIYHSEVCIWKDPVTAMQRTKALGLLHKQLKKDSCMSRQGIPDYLVTMRKPGDNPERVEGLLEYYVGDDPVYLTKQERGWSDEIKKSIDIWQRYASPVWMDINQSNTLQRESAREEEDEKHICPLQIDVIERALQLWTNPGDIVLDPFNGIGSSGYVALKTGRRYVGIELKKSYFDQSVKNLQRAEQEASQPSLLDFMDENMEVR